MKNTSDVWQRLEGVCVLQENFIRQKHQRDILGKENQTHAHTPQVKSKYHSAVRVYVYDPHHQVTQTVTAGGSRRSVIPPAGFGNRKITGLCLLHSTRRLDGWVFSPVGEVIGEGVSVSEVGGG